MLENVIDAFIIAKVKDYAKERGLTLDYKKLEPLLCKLSKAQYEVLKLIMPNFNELDPLLPALVAGAICKAINIATDNLLNTILFENIKCECPSCRSVN